MTFPKDAMQPTLTLLFDGMTDDEIASAVVGALGVDKTLGLFWSLYSALPVVVEGSVDKVDIEHSPYEGFKILGSDAEIASAMRNVTTNKWQRSHETLLDAVVARLLEQGLIRVRSDTDSEVTP